MEDVIASIKSRLKSITIKYYIYGDDSELRALEKECETSTGHMYKVAYPGCSVCEYCDKMIRHEK